ncbi:MAG: hypothetical protein ACT4OM_06125 [Actinomycetota bacterium]
MALAIELGIELVSIDGKRLNPSELVEAAVGPRRDLSSLGWSSSEMDVAVPSLDALSGSHGQISAQSRVFNWLGDERTRQVREFGPEFDDHRTTDSGIEPGGWWTLQLERYIGDARVHGLGSLEGRASLSKFVATACSLLESTTRLFGPIPEREDPSERD